MSWATPGHPRRTCARPERHRQRACRGRHAPSRRHAATTASAAPGADGNGLLGLRDRLAALDGWLRVESPLESGTLVAADLPLPD